MGSKVNKEDLIDPRKRIIDQRGAKFLVVADKMMVFTGFDGRGQIYHRDFLRGLVEPGLVQDAGYIDVEKVLKFAEGDTDKRDVIRTIYKGASSLGHRFDIYAARDYREGKLTEALDKYFDVTSGLK